MVRAFKQSDMEAILKIWLTASYRAHDFIEREFWDSKVDDMRDIYLPGSESYVYERDGELCGFFSLAENCLAAIFVDPALQRQGIGKKLIAKAQSLREHLDLTVYKKNSASISFYETVGFERVKEQIDEATGQAELLMSWSAAKEIKE